MDEKTLQILEYPKILDRLAGFTAFSASAEKARALRPTADIEEARRRQAETSEAVSLLATRPDMTIGGARDVRGPVDLAVRGGVLDPTDLLDVKYTLVAARTIARTFERLETQFPHLSELAGRLPASLGLIDIISRAISDRGDILDSASVKLAGIRRDMRIAHERLMSKLQHMVNDPQNATLLQEAIVTQRDGRYVLPLRAEFKGRIKSIVHDQSSSGATLFVEPLAVVDLNNQYRELQLAERDEERRILAELSDQVAQQAQPILAAVENLAELDMILARGKYSEALRGSQPVLHPIRAARRLPRGDRRERHEKGESASRPGKDDRHPGAVIRLIEARHPLLDPHTVVAIDVELDAETYALIITGPNTGGKTVTLKTTGLLALMAQAGLHIPAHSGSEISVFENIYADIGDEQSIEQSLSTFSGHITNIRRILHRADRRSLVILDELGAGTDPQEGAALARAILSHLLERGITTLVTTHHPELKAYAHATPGVSNASVEFDLETLRPTYKLTIGLPGRSNAVAIASRLGLPQEIIQAARQELNPQDLQADDLLNEIHHQRELALQARSQADRTLREAESLRSELAQRADQIEDERREVLEAARQEAAGRVQELEEEIRQVRRALARARQPLEALQAVEEKTAELQEVVEKPVERKQPDIELAPSRSIRLGDRVLLRTLNTQGIVTALGEEEAEVQVGNLRVRTRLADLNLPGAAAPAPANAGGKSSAPGSSAKAKAPRPAPAAPPPPETREAFLPESPGMELDLRGQRAEDALDALDRYLDQAYLAGLPFVRIIHGKGTGRLRDVVRQTLNGHAHVRSFESGGEKEGGDGVTVAKLST